MIAALTASTADVMGATCKTVTWRFFGPSVSMLAGQIAHLGVLKPCTAFSDANAQPHHGIPVNARYALNGADTRAFCQCADYRDLLVSAEDVCHVRSPYGY
jgi:hypothetical protein